MTLPVRSVLIVGGGIAGLSAAIALARHGARVRVVDLHGQADGASIAITNRAVDAMEALGVLDDVIAAGVPLTGGTTIFARMHDGAGNPLPMQPPPPRPDQRLPASISIFRPELARVLRAHAERHGAEIVVGDTVTALEPAGEQVRAGFRSSDAAAYDLVVGADGTRSSTRSLVFGEIVTPAYTGLMGFRWVCRDGPPGQSGFFVLPSNDMVATTRLPGNLLYLATGRTMENRRIAQDEARDMLRDILANYTAPLLVALRERLDDAQQIIARPYEWLMVPEPWHRGRVVLIGDAAHSTTAHLSSGGSMAIEDAVVLADELDAAGEVGTGLDRFVRRRFERCRLVVDTSVELVRLEQAHADRGVSQALRGKAVGALMQPY